MWTCIERPGLQCEFKNFPQQKQFNYFFISFLFFIVSLIALFSLLIFVLVYIFCRIFLYRTLFSTQPVLSIRFVLICFLIFLRFKTCHQIEIWSIVLFNFNYNFRCDIIWQQYCRKYSVDLQKTNPCRQNSSRGIEHYTHTQLEYIQLK